MKRVDVAVSPPYPVLVGSGMLDQLGEYVEEQSVVVVSDAHVARLYLDRVSRALSQHNERSEVVRIEVPAGEGSKSIEVLTDILRDMAGAGLRRDCAVVSLGGGVVSDLAGYAAASYLRGVAFYTCPTSLLAMVDASVGGKTGVNLPEGKNLVGAFWQPRAVVADVESLSSLSIREFRSGAVELVKAGLLADTQLLAALDDPDFTPGGESRVLEYYVARAVAVKARVVGQDERETGERAQLNLGHSLAHALEAASRGSLGHGDAVAYGLLFAAMLGANRGWYDFREFARKLLEWLQPPPLPVREYDVLMPYLLRDKKNSGRGQRFVLLHEPCTPVLVDDVDDAEQRRAWSQLLEATT